MVATTDEKSRWITRVLGVTIGETAAGPTAPQAPAGVAAALAAWKAERLRAIAALNKLEVLVRATQHPERDAAVVLLRAIRANLTETPETAQQIAELKAYIRSDDIFATAEMPNVFGVRINIRIPLSEAVTGLQTAMQSAQG
jgi:hypothetical protein